jgi:hypothetical protein
MVWYSIVILAAIGFVTWFVRTPTFRHRRAGHAKLRDDQSASHYAEVSMLNANNQFRKND